MKVQITLNDKAGDQLDEMTELMGSSRAAVITTSLNIMAKLFSTNAEALQSVLGKSDDPSDDKAPPTAIASSDEGLGSITSENNKQVGSAEQSTPITTGGQQSHQPAPKTFSAGNQVIDNPMGGKNAPKGNDRKDWMIYKMPEELLLMSRRDDLTRDEIRVLKNLNNLIMSGGVPQKVIDMAMQDLRDIAGAF